MTNDDDRYECPTCSYATTSYQRFVEHGKTHSLNNLRPIIEDLMSAIASTSADQMNKAYKRAAEALAKERL